METEPNFTDHRQQSPLNANSGLTIGLAIILITCALWIRDGQNSAELNRSKDAAENARSVAEVKVEIANLQRDVSDKTRDRFTTADMFHWAVQLQRENNAAGIKLIVPDPQRQP